ncbi:hypothetical protein VTH06DRAFT_4161 [Thermothelomyces fergusii]
MYSINLFLKPHVHTPVLSSVVGAREQAGGSIVFFLPRSRNPRIKIEDVESFSHNHQSAWISVANIFLFLPSSLNLSPPGVSSMLRQFPNQWCLSVARQANDVEIAKAREKSRKLSLFQRCSFPRASLKRMIGNGCQSQKPLVAPNTRGNSEDSCLVVSGSR